MLSTTNIDSNLFTAKKFLIRELEKRRSQLVLAQLFNPDLKEL
jgi:hypothetical protein